jgi:hypothetical protein
MQQRKVKPYSFALPPGLKRDIDKAARADGVSKSDFARRAFMKELDAKDRMIERDAPRMGRRDALKSRAGYECPEMSPKRTPSVRPGMDTPQIGTSWRDPKER